MKTKDKNIAILRENLLSKEINLAGELEKESEYLEKKLESGLKTAAFVGAGLIIGLAIYKLFENNKETNSGKNKEKEKRRTQNKTKTAPSGLSSSILTVALKKLIPYALEWLGTQNTKSMKNDKPTR